MSKIDEYRRRLRDLKEWRPYLLAECGLPGPRGNLELAYAVSLEINPRQINAFLSIPIGQAPENTPQVFLVFCGVLALGRLIAAGDLEQLKRLRPYASDTRWRIREAVAMALQAIGDSNINCCCVRQIDGARQLVREARRSGGPGGTAAAQGRIVHGNCAAGSP